MEDLIELIAPGGCDEANHGTARYRVDNDGRIRVPREAAYWLIRNGGFRPASAMPDLPLFNNAPARPASPTTAPQQDGDGAAKAAATDPRRTPRRSTT